MKVHRFFWPAVQGVCVALAILTAGGVVGWFIADLIEPTKAQVCARSNETGSSAWVSCVDRLIQEAAK